MLTDNDLRKIKAIFSQRNISLEKRMDKIGGVIGKIVEETNNVKELVEEIKERTRLLPTKDEFFTAMDKLMDEIKKSREEQTAISGRISVHEDRLEKLEKTVVTSAPA